VNISESDTLESLRTTHNTATKSVQSLLEDVGLFSETNHDIVQAVRALVKKSFKTASEEVKYGGILFSSGVPFCGVFAYKEHVSVGVGSGVKTAIAIVAGNV
jgi:hypothetical protein